MDDAERRRQETFKAVIQYAADNTGDFTGTIETTQLTALTDENTLMDGFAVSQAGAKGSAGHAFENKDTARENLREQMEPIARTARMMEYAFDGIADIFRMPRNRSDLEMLNTSRAWVIAAVPYTSDFIAYGLPTHFITALGNAADAFENSMPATTTATDERVAATAEIGASSRRSMIALRILDAVMRNKYAGDAGKLAAWLSASHIEKAPKSKAPPTP